MKLISNSTLHTQIILSISLFLHFFFLFIFSLIFLSAFKHLLIFKNNNNNNKTTTMPTLIKTLVEMQLNLSHRNLRSLDSAIIASYADCTEYLDVSHNCIRDLMWLYDFPHLKCLIMDDNRLREPHFDRLNRPLTKIHTLMLNKNEVSSTIILTMFS